MPETYIPGRIMDATVDGEPALVYLSLRVEGTNAERRNHCFRYAPPSNEVVTGQTEITHEDHYRTQRPTRPDGSRASTNPS
jgi:hypothetical protein